MGIVGSVFSTDFSLELGFKGLCFKFPKRNQERPMCNKSLLFSVELLFCCKQPLNTMNLKGLKLFKFMLILYNKGTEISITTCSNEHLLTLIDVPLSH